MNFAPIEAIANAVLFEGYILYPYRPSALKNRQRWNFGTLYPRTFAEAQAPPERWRFMAQTLLQADDDALLFAQARLIQLEPSVEENMQGWQQGIVRSRTTQGMTFAQLRSGLGQDWNLHELSNEERTRSTSWSTECRGVGRLWCTAEQIRSGFYRVSVSFANETPLVAADMVSRASVLSAAFTSAHLLLGVEGGEFVSLLEPPCELESVAATCAQDGVFPVLAGVPGSRACMLVSPIILYDYPQVAPESSGDFFDGTEMDEMLALRVLTLTEDEKAEVRAGDPQARALLERMETLPAEQLLKAHGAVRGLQRAILSEFERPMTGEHPDLKGVAFDPFAPRSPLDSVRVFGIELHTGDRVRLWPQKKADILDMAMEGKIAIIEAIEQDLEDNVQFAVVLEDDPGRDMGMLRQAGHRFFFAPDEVEPLQLEVP